MVEAAKMAPRLGVFQKLACRWGYHHRDGNNVRRVNKMWRSVCIGCGASMVKTDDGWMRRMDLPDANQPNVNQADVNQANVNQGRAGEYGL